MPSAIAVSDPPNHRRVKAGMEHKRPLAALDAGNPIDAIEQPTLGNFNRCGDLEQRLDARDPEAALQETDLGSMQSGPASQLLLAHPGQPATAPQVLTEMTGEIVVALSGRHQCAFPTPQTWRRRSANASCSATTRSYSFASSTDSASSPSARQM